MITTINEWKRLNEKPAINTIDKIEENMLLNLLLPFTMLVGGSAIGQNKDNIQHKTVHTQSEVDRLVKAGWKLTHTEVDTVWSDIITKAPKTDVMAVNLHLKDDEHFASGSFVLTTEMKLSIDSVLGVISKNNGVILNINIESSTDQQPLSKNLQSIVGDNLGLSKARSTSIATYLDNKEEIKIDKDLFNITNLTEQGTGIDPSARYVNVDFFYIQIPDSVKSDTTTTYTVKTSFDLEKEPFGKPKPPYKFHGKNTYIHKLGPINNHIKRQNLTCPRFNSKNGPHDTMFNK